MKALIRNENETVTEDMHIPGIDWSTGMPLTSPYWAGGPYMLVMDYEPTQADDSIESTEPSVIVGTDADTDIVVIDGVEYRRV